MINEWLRYFYKFGNVYDKEGFSVTQVMNLFFKSYCRYLIFFAFITCESSFNAALSQQNIYFLTPWIQEIELPSPYRELANESFYLDHQETLFLGKENGLSIIEGNNTLHIQMKGPVFVTGNHSDTLYYAAAGDVGLLVMRDRSEITQLSRKHWIPASQRDFIPTDILFYQDHLFINTDRGIFSFKGSSYKLHPVEGGQPQLKLIRDRLFLLLGNDSILTWNGNEFAGQTESDRQLINALHFLSNTTSSNNQSSFIGHLQQNLILAKEEATGLIILDENGRVINQLGGSAGLPDREIRQVMVRDGREIWVLGPHSLHRITYPSPLRMLGFESFESGRILNSIMIGDTLFAGTSHGLFRLNSQADQPDRIEVENLLPHGKESIHLLSVSEGQLFAAGITHLYTIQEGRSTMLGEGFFSGISALGKNRVVAGTRKGIILYEKDYAGWNVRNLEASLTSAYSFVIHQHDLFFICDNGVYRLSPDQYEIAPTSFHSEELLFRLVELRDQLYLISRDKVYFFDSEENTFLPLSEGIKSQMISSSDLLVPEPSGSTWSVQHQGKYRSIVTQISGLEINPEEHLTYPILQTLGEIVNLQFQDSILYITGRDKVSFLNLGIVQQTHADNLLHLEKVSQKDGNIEFYLAGLEFQSTPEPLFRYRLHPGQHGWSEWNADRKLVLRGLKHGNYTIEAQAVDLYGRQTDPAEYAFDVAPPLYNTWYAYVLYGLLFLFGLFLLRKWRLLSYQRAESLISERMQAKIDQMAMEKARSDKLASEFLPDKTAAQMKIAGKAKWDKYERATVLFSDIQGFTRIAEEMNPESLIDELDKFFFHFDSVVEKYNIEKIKTIGDAYMAAGGIPEKNSTNPVEVVLAALEMQSYMAQLKAKRTNIWDLRIGIHTGPVIAGVVGHKKVSYDIWGDTVNTASRMESSGMPGKVNISGITYGMVKDYFICEYRGKLPVKYKGNIDMYFVKGLRPELTVDLKEIPNKRFFTKLQILRLGDIEERVFDGILKDLPESVHFHNLEHARKVYNQSFMLSRAEEIEQEERLLVRTAALMLFTGLTQSYSNFENRSAVIARELLFRYKYAEYQIDQICNLILATKIPFQPNNKLEKIIIDARMEFLGRSDYTEQIKLLYQEIREAGVKITGQQFKNQQLELLHEFEFYTTAAQRLREVKGPQQMTRLEQERWI